MLRRTTTGRASSCCVGPRYTRWGLALTIVMVALLVAAVGTPWYGSVWRHVTPMMEGSSSSTSTEHLLLCWWSGLFVHTSSNSADASPATTTTSVTTKDGEKEEKENYGWQAISWNEKSYQLVVPKIVYLYANVMALLCIVSGFFLALCLFCGLTSCACPARFFRRHRSHFKSTIVCLATLNLLFSTLSWLIFLYFPAALSNRCVRSLWH